VPSSPERPHGLECSLTLHDGDNQRLSGLTTPIRLSREQDQERERGSNTTTSIKANV
jgi:hypothetical protein